MGYINVTADFNFFLDFCILLKGVDSRQKLYDVVNRKLSIVTVVPRKAAIFKNVCPNEGRNYKTIYCVGWFNL